MIDEPEADKVRWIFTRYVQTGSVTTVVRELVTEGFVTRKGQRLYRYYVSQSVIRGVGQVDGDTGRADLVTRVPAGDVEAAVMDQLRLMLRSPEIIVATWRAARRDLPDLTEAEVREALARFDLLWNELFPAEQTRIVRLLVDRVDIAANGVVIRLRVDGLGSLLTEMRGGQAAACADDGKVVEERAA